MLLGASSSAIEAPADAGAVMTDEPADGGVPAGAELLAFTTAIHGLDDTLIGPSAGRRSCRA